MFRSAAGEARFFILIPHRKLTSISCSVEISLDVKVITGDFSKNGGVLHGVNMRGKITCGISVVGMVLAVATVPQRAALRRARTPAAEQGRALDAGPPPGP